MTTITHFVKHKGVRYSCIATVDGDNWRGVIFLEDKHIVDYVSGSGAALDEEKLVRKMWARYKAWNKL